MLFWEIRSKFYELTSQTIKTKSVSDLAYYGQLLKQIKEIIRETEHQQKQITQEKQQDKARQTVASPNSNEKEGVTSPVALKKQSSSEETLFSIIENTIKLEPKKPSNSNPEKKRILRNTLKQLDTLLENNEIQQVNNLIEQNPEFQSFFTILSSRSDEKEKIQTTFNLQQLEEKSDFSSSSETEQVSSSSEKELSFSLERRGTREKFEDTFDLTHLLDLPCVLDEDVPTLINFTAKAEGIELDSRPTSVNSTLSSSQSNTQTSKSFLGPSSSLSSPQTIIQPNTTFSLPSVQDIVYPCTRCGTSSNQPWKFCGVCGHSYGKNKQT